MEQSIPKILVVDDEEYLLLLTSQLMESASYEVRSTSSGKECIDICRQWQPELVLLDVWLEDEDGVQVCRELKRIPELETMMVVLISGRCTSSDQQAEGLRLGGDGYIARPIQSRELLARIQAYLRIQTAGRERRALENRLQEKLRLEALGTLAGGIGHEIANPLSGIIGFAQLIEDVADEESDIASYAVSITRECRRIEATINSIRTLGQVHGSVGKLDELPTLLNHLATLVQAMLNERGHILLVEVPDALPAVQFAAEQLEYVVVQLITNASHAIVSLPDHGVTNNVIKLSACEGWDGDAPCVRLTVEDHGTGIAADVRKRIFEPFFTTKNCTQAEGLGLSAVRQIVLQQGGDLKVESEVGLFTKFHVDLPVLKEPETVVAD
ncbi:MAG: response regulator [Lentisphaeria bacterium]|nr:response regulator [Lentisphaeria bacterium]